MILIVLVVILILYIAKRVFPPIYYWKKRNVFYVNPLSRIYEVFFGKKSLAEIVKEAYDQFPDRRYYGSYQFLKPSLFIRDVDIIKQITIKDFDHFTDHVDILNSSNDPIFSKNLFSLKGREWREVRSTLSPAFTSSKMKAMFVLISEASKKFVEHFEALDKDLVEVEMKETYSKFTNDVIATCAFGISCDTLENPDNEFFAMGKAVTRSSLLRMMRAMLMMFFPKVFEVLKIKAFSNDITDFFKRIITDTISTREKEGTIRPDLIHLLMEARKGKLQENPSSTTEDTGFATAQESKDTKIKSTLEITDDLITAQALIFFLAGLETSSSLLSFLSYELAKNPDIQRKLTKEVDDNMSTTDSFVSYEKLSKMKYLDQVVSEGLRKWTPGFALNRVCTKDYTIPPKHEDEPPLTLTKGCFVMIPVVGIHYDPKYFENPDVFDPDRFSDENKKNIVPGSYIPFGIGPRNCIGSRFALLEIKAVMVQLLDKFEFTFIERTAVPLKLKKTFGLMVEGGTWLGLKRRSKNK
ncbi:cytochrome P450 9e2-like [Coccinella septempunctata]|uniref:cytochrome P450 9e2-like n=1 Tax=Coccinella septempunctata TaxID=41139 RepID=UPI001D08CEF1|nr:cytochrome P450 9e2-like [Coccinella septempunctata]